MTKAAIVKDQWLSWLRHGVGRQLQQGQYVIASIDCFVEPTLQTSDRTIYENGAAGGTAPLDIGESVAGFLRQLTTGLSL